MKGDSNINKRLKHYLSNVQKHLVQTENTNEIYRHCVYNVQKIAKFFYFFGIALRNFIKYTSYKYKASILPTKSNLKNSKLISIQYNNTGEPDKFILFLEKNNKPMFKMSKGLTNNTV